MEPRRPNRAAWPLALVIAYALAGAAWGVARTPLGPAEAKDLLAARAAPSDGPGARPPGDAPASSHAAATSASPAAAALAPAAAAWAERRGGLAGARLAFVVLGLAIVLLVHRAGDAPAWGRRGPLVAATFVLLGVPLQLFATVHPRVVAALFLALSMALAEEPARDAAGPRRAASLGAAALAGAALAAAVLASALAAPFAAALAVALGLPLLCRDRAAAATFAVAGAAALAISGGLAASPPWPELAQALWPFRRDGASAAPGQLARVLDGLAMPLLLATFALFHRDGGARAAAAMAVSCAAFLIPFASAMRDDAHTARLLAFVVLAPSAGVGVARMTEIFASDNPSSRARPAFTAAVLVIIGVFGIHEARVLRREAPDLSAAVAFLAADGAGGRTLLVDSDFGSPEYVYRYYLGSATPPARIVPIVRADAAERRHALRDARPDYVVLDEHHSDRSFGAASREYLGLGFTIAATYEMPLASRARSVQILRREAP